MHHLKTNIGSVIEKTKYNIVLIMRSGYDPAQFFSSCKTVSAPR